MRGVLGRLCGARSKALEQASPLTGISIYPFFSSQQQLAPSAPDERHLLQEPTESQCALGELWTSQAM